MPNPPTGAPKPRKPRPSRARGLRTTTGCLTCRKRRVKCDETKPCCTPCSKSKRECAYAVTTTITTPSTEESNAAPSVPEEASVPSQPGTVGSLNANDSPELRFDLSPLTITASLPSPNSAPFEWYDLLAEDAINNIERHNLGFDQTSLSRRQSPVPEFLNAAGPRLTVEPEYQSPKVSVDVDAEISSNEPWNSTQILALTETELTLMQHFVNVVGPILDLLDPHRQFSTTVPRLAVHNVGLLKSLLAVAARHMALHSAETQPDQMTDGNITDPAGRRNPFTQVATQYYYETLHYLSQNLLYPSYTRSGVIIATAILISTYEMFDAEGSYSDGGWERHLRGIFWIQRGQNIDGETVDPLRKAAWWAWLRQDIWVAFRENRRTLTIWRPRRRLMDLNADDLVTRIVYITARCVDFAANEKNYDMGLRIEQGDKLLQALDDWYQILPSCFKPIYAQAHTESNVFTPLWINPPMYAAAVQTFHFARIVVIINQPSVGGMSAFRQQQKLLDESVESICGIAMMQQNHLESAFVNFQALYVAGLCVQNPVKQLAIKQLLEATLDLAKFPPKTLLNDLTNFWREAQ